MKRVEHVVAGCPWRVVVLLVAVALFSSSARTNERFFYCDAMGLLDHDPCAATSAPEKTAAVSTPHHDCCKIVVVRTLPQAVSSGGLVVSPPAFVTEALVPIARARTEIAPARRVARGRGPPLASERRAELMIFLT